MSEKKRGRPRDNNLDLSADRSPELRKRMSLVNRRDMMEASRVLGLGTADGKKEFAYIVNNGNWRKSVLTELGRYIRRYGMSRNDVREFARIICKEKVKAKKVRGMLETYKNFINSTYKISSNDAIQLAGAVCQGKLTLKQVKQMLRAYRRKKTISQVKQEIEHETQYRDTERVGGACVIRMNNWEDFKASLEKLGQLLYSPSRGDKIELTASYLKEEELDKLIKEGKLRLISKNPELFQVQDGSDELD